MKETKFPFPTAVKDGDEGGAVDINGGEVVKLYIRLTLIIICLHTLASLNVDTCTL